MTNQSTSYYLFGGPRLRGDDGVAMRTNGAVYRLHGDHPSTRSGRRLSSVSAGTDETGAVVGRQLFAPYGEARGGGGMAGVPWGWATHRPAEGHGLVFMRARWYAPAVGRFVSADTVVQTNSKQPAPFLLLTVSYANSKVLGLWNDSHRETRRLQPQTSNTQTSDPQFLNRYSYIRNNPLAGADPGGNLAWFIAPLVGGALIGGTISTAAYLVAAHLTGQEITAGGVAGAFASGAVAGAVSVFATPLAGSALKIAGMAATNTALTAGAAAVNAAGGATAYLAGGAVENIVNTTTGTGITFQPSLGGAAFNAATAGLLSVGLGKAFPVSNSTMRTLNQAKCFMPGRHNVEKIWQSRLIAGNARNLYWRQTAVSVGVGSVSGTSYQNLLVEQP